MLYLARSSSILPTPFLAIVIFDASIKPASLSDNCCARSVPAPDRLPGHSQLYELLPHYDKVENDYICGHCTVEAIASCFMKYSSNQFSRAMCSVRDWKLNEQWIWVRNFTVVARPIKYGNWIYFSTRINVSVFDKIISPIQLFSYQ